ncbi:MAG: hypothetical protein LBC93_00585 [Synergistaceae bacterium]|jgi:hypothetical protein|nr:hypothetical protein [Synergistaceae bacterium]
MKKNKGVSLGRFSLRAAAVCLTVLLILPGTASAVVKDGRIEDVVGFRFQNVVYNWDNIFIDIVNMTDRNVSFGGTMTFVDRNGYPVARVHLLPKKVVRKSVERYTGYCLEGTGETARRAVRVIWDSSSR